MSTPTYPLYFTASGQPAFTTATAQGGFIIDYPFGERRPDALVIRQRFMQLRTEYVRPASNATNCSAYPAARFCDDTAFRDVGMGIVEWTRVWATVPGQIIDYETYAYVYPGYASSLAAYGRVPLPSQVTSKLIVDFFLVGSGGTYADAGAIPVYQGQAYSYGPYSGEIAAEYLSSTSSPTITAYKALATTDAADSASYSIEAHDSSLEFYMGNIWRRTRRLIKAR